jgi:hypothetical protein
MLYVYIYMGEGGSCAVIRVETDPRGRGERPITEVTNTAQEKKKLM